MDEEQTLVQKARNQLKQFLTECRIQEYKVKSILEIGFKNGLFLNECHKAGLIPMGIEINKKYCDTVTLKFPYLNIIWYDGGTVPLSDESFDFVVSYQLFEHVTSTEHMLNECIRVLKPGGTMFHVCPNHHSFYDGHFNVIWLPFLSKASGRLYLKLLRRYRPDYETLNIVKPKEVAQILQRHNCIRIISLGRAEFINKFNLEQIEKLNLKLLQKILKLLLRLRFLTRIIVQLIAKADVYYPITIIARKE